MNSPSIEDRLAPSDQVVIRELSGESVLLDLKSGLYFGLNGVGTRVWNLVAQGGSLREVNAALAHEFEAPAAIIEAEVLRFAAELCRHGLCHVAEPR
ncbi:MAG TPA: PqqD family protein [Vicinamibacterales bacterium]|jgi:hypothetical protein|nr:PqqD family protein [Vicinamibacterales bacterium]